VLLPDLRSDKDADEISEKLLATVAQPIRIGKHEIIVTGEHRHQLLSRCDESTVSSKTLTCHVSRQEQRTQRLTSLYAGIGMQGLQQYADGIGHA